MSFDDKIDRLILGKKFDEFVEEIPSDDSIEEEFMQSLLSKHPIRILGTSQEGSVILTEEDRESHIHILGSPGEGKSKYLELLLRQDIDNGYGATLLDPSDNGETAYKVLKYAIKKGYEKVVLIEPHDIIEKDPESRTPCLNPINYKAPAPAVVGKIMDSIRVLFNTKDFSETPRIQKYLPAVLNALYAAKFTLAESRYFMENYIYKVRRDKILESLDPFDLNRAHLEAAFRNVPTFEQFQSTVNRLNPFLDPTMELIIGSQNGMNFQKLISEKYLILVNLDPDGVWQEEQRKLLGTLIMSEIQAAISRLRINGWKGRHYLYVDEAGLFGTRKLANFLYHKRKSG
jgi:hypothetical protein